MVNFTNLICAGSDSVAPLYEAITLIGPYAMAIILILAIFFGIFMGVKLAKCDDSKERPLLQNALISGIIGILAIFVLVAILYGIREPLYNWMNS